MSDNNERTLGVKKKEEASGEYEYQRMSLRHEHVENDKLPKINIFYSAGNDERARQVGYGVEEEGLPYRLNESGEPFDEARADIIKKGLGVSIGIDGGLANIFNRQLKKEEPFMRYEGIDIEKLRIVGKNSARIVKHKPFVMED